MRGRPGIVAGEVRTASRGLAWRVPGRPATPPEHESCNPWLENRHRAKRTCPTLAGLFAHSVMESSPVVRTRFTWQSWTLMVLVALITLAPWWRNHHYLRDFYDYGLVVAGGGRIAAGGRRSLELLPPSHAATL